MRKIIPFIPVIWTLLFPAFAQSAPRSWRVHFDSVASADRSIRDIDAVAMTVSTPWRSWEPFTLGLQGGMISTSGSSIEPNDFFPSRADSNALFAGGYLRFSPLEPALITPFAEGGIALLVNDRPFPDHPSLSGPDARVYGKFDIRWGVDIAVNNEFQIEAAFALTHISNGSGFGPQNINYDGVGMSLGIIRSW